MTLVNFNGGFYFPEMLGGTGGSYFFPATLAVAASGQAIGFVFEAPRTGNIDRAWALIATHTATATTLVCRLETVTGSGVPNSAPTLVGTGASANISTTAVATISAAFGATLPAVVKGSSYALTYRLVGAGNVELRTWGSTNNIAFGWKSRRCYPTTRADTGAWVATTNANTYAHVPNFAVRYDDGACYPVHGILSVSAQEKTAFNNTTASRERGARINLPFPTQIAGWYLHGDYSNSDCAVVLAASDGTVLASANVDKDTGSGYSLGTNYGGTYRGYFETSVSVARNVDFHLTLKPLSASDVMLTQVENLAGSSQPAIIGMWNGASAFCLVSRDSGGVYTIDRTRRPISMGIIVEAFDDGSATVVSGGGGSNSLALISHVY